MPHRRPSVLLAFAVLFAAAGPAAAQSEVTRLFAPRGNAVQLAPAAATRLAGGLPGAARGPFVEALKAAYKRVAPGNPATVQRVVVYATDSLDVYAGMGVPDGEARKTGRGLSVDLWAHLYVDGRTVWYVRPPAGDAVRIAVVRRVAGGTPGVTAPGTARGVTAALAALAADRVQAVAGDSFVFDGPPLDGALLLPAAEGRAPTYDQGAAYARFIDAETKRAGGLPPFGRGFDWRTVTLPRGFDWAAPIDDTGAFRRFDEVAAAVAAGGEPVGIKLTGADVLPSRAFAAQALAAAQRITAELTAAETADGGPAELFPGSRPPPVLSLQSLTTALPVFQTYYDPAPDNLPSRAFQAYELVQQARRYDARDDALEFARNGSFAARSAMIARRDLEPAAMWFAEGGADDRGAAHALEALETLLVARVQALREVLDLAALGYLKAQDVNRVNIRADAAVSLPPPPADPGDPKKPDAVVPERLRLVARAHLALNGIWAPILDRLMPLVPDGVSPALTADETAGFDVGSAPYGAVKLPLVGVKIPQAAATESLYYTRRFFVPLASGAARIVAFDMPLRRRLKLTVGGFVAPKGAVPVPAAQALAAGRCAPGDLEYRFVPARGPDGAAPQRDAVRWSCIEKAAYDFNPEHKPFVEYGTVEVRLRPNAAPFEGIWLLSAEAVDVRPSRRSSGASPITFVRRFR